MGRAANATTLVLAMVWNAVAYASPAAAQPMQSDSDAYFAHLSPPDQQSVNVLARRAQTIVAEINSDQIRFSQDYSAIQLMDVLKPQFVQADTDGAEARRRLASARSLVEHARDARRARDSEFGQIITSSQLSPKLREHYRAGLEALVADARPEREQGYKLLDQMFDEVDAASKVLQDAKWDRQSYATLPDADARAFNEHASKANTLIRQKAALDAEMRQQIARRTQ